MSESWRNQQVLITGVAGFLGSHLADALLLAGAQVWGIDSLLTGSQENIAHLKGKLKYQTADAAAIESYASQNQRFDCVFHLASPASPPIYQKYPRETYHANIWATEAILEWLRLHSPQARMVFASSSEVYGEPLQHPQEESYWGNVNPNGPRSCYDESKRMGETICGIYARDFHMDCRIGRFFNTYGPRMGAKDGRVIPTLINQALQHLPLTVHGTGKQTRSYCYVADLISGLMALGVEPAARNQTVNLGNPAEISVLETVDVIRSLVPGAAKLTINYTPALVDDPSRRRPDITKAKNLLNWQPTTKLTDGLLLTIKYFQNQLERA